MEQWYSNKDLLEMMNDLKLDITNLRVEIKETKTLIRDYNNLRTKVEKTTAKVNTLMWATPVAISAIGIIFVVLNYIGK